MLLFQTSNPDYQPPALRKCIEYISNNPKLALGVIDLGDGIRCIVSSYQTVDEETAFWEAHKQFVDVHCILQGEERIRIAPISECQIGSYHEKRDYLEVIGRNLVDIWMVPGLILCLFPNDAHQVKVHAIPGKTEQVLKAVFKIPVQRMYTVFND